MPSPTPPPVTAPSPSPPTVSPCAAELAIVSACIPTQSCADCLNAAWEALPSEGFCWEFVDALCPAITTTCSCGFCEQVIEDFYGCALSDATNGGCSGGVECGGIPTPPPVPNPTPQPVATPTSAPVLPPVPIPLPAPGPPSALTNEEGGNGLPPDSSAVTSSLFAAVIGLQLFWLVLSL